MNLCFSHKFILHKISLLSWHWNKVGSKSGPMASKHCGERFSKSGNWRQMSTEKLLPRQPGKAMYSGLARQSSKGSLHLAVLMRSGFARHNSTVNPFYKYKVSWSQFYDNDIVHLGSIVQSIVRMQSPGPCVGVLNGLWWQLGLEGHHHGVALHRHKECC